MRGPLIHIGYHRTGTTWLQRFLFVAGSGTGFVSPFERIEIVERLILPNSLDFEAQQCSEYFHPPILRSIDQDLVPVLTEEDLAGNPNSGGYNSKELANRLFEVFPEGRVLIIIREQVSMILSTYSAYVRGSGPCSLENYIQPPLSGRGRVPLFDLDHFKYHRLIKHYMNLYGNANVLVLPYEQFRSRPDDFVSRIVLFAGAKTVDNLPYSSRVNTSFSGFSIAIMRHLNHFTARDSVNPWVVFHVPGLARVSRFCLRKVDSALPGSLRRAIDNRHRTRVSEIVGDRYKESNRLTGELIGLDLEHYGYNV